MSAFLNPAMRPASSGLTASITASSTRAFDTREKEHPTWGQAAREALGDPDRFDAFVAATLAAVTTNEELSPTSRPG